MGDCLRRTDSIVTGTYGLWGTEKLRRPGVRRAWEELGTHSYPCHLLHSCLRFTRAKWVRKRRRT